MEEEKCRGEYYFMNNNQCIKLVINIWSIHDTRAEKHEVVLRKFAHISLP